MRIRKGKSKTKAMKEMVATSINEALDVKFQSILHDIEYRIDCLYSNATESITGAMGKLGSRDLNLSKHQLDGYTISDNLPIAGSIAWTSCNVVYKGINYAIVDGNTALKFVYWTLLQADKTIFLTSDTKPTLLEDDVLVFVNEGGTHATVMGGMTTGSALLDGTVGGSEVKTGGISALNLGTGAVTNGKIFAGAVDATAIGTGAVTSTKILAGAVLTAAIGADQITTALIAPLAVTATEIGAGAVTGAKIAGTTITGANMVNGTITGTQIGAGSVASDRLNMAMHLLM